MIPPTPTQIPYIPPEEMPIQFPIPDIWDMAPEVVQKWNQLPDFIAFSIQAFILIVIVVIGYRVVVNFLHNLANEAVVTEE